MINLLKLALDAQSLTKLSSFSNLASSSTFSKASCSEQHSLSQGNPFLSGKERSDMCSAAGGNTYASATSVLKLL